MSRALWVARAVLITATVALLFVPERGIQFGWTVGLHLTATAAWLLLVWAVVRGQWRPSFVEAFGLAVLLRGIALFLDPALSDDIYRYMYEGRLVLEGINPYLTPPDDFTVMDLRHPVYWELINNKEIPAAYPPAVQFVLAIGAWISQHPLGMKLVFGLFDLAVFVVLWFWLPLMNLPRERAIIHGLCPLMVLEFAGEGHSDSLAVFAVVLALWLSMRGRHLLSGAALAIATAGKLMPIVLLPYMMRRSWHVLPLLVVGMLALYLPFMEWDDPLAMFRGTYEYAARWRNNDSLFHAIHAGTEWLQGKGWFAEYETQRVSKFPLAALGVSVLGICYLKKLPAERAALWFFVFFVAAAPTLHPWYLAFLVPFLAIAPNPGWLLFTGTVILSYHVLPGWLTEQRWEESVEVKVVEYLPFYGGLLYALLRRDKAAVAEAP